ncbi:hypothetical protein G6F56_009803 [Rhizopus delemar]|nr:hypothetical protein G6F56_009803 [Rhizopus delemar]
MVSPLNEAVDTNNMKQYHKESFFLQEEEEEEDRNDPFYLANRTFYTTCHKISRQNNPTLRKRPPYTFLENWLIHSLFSKSQQILLRFPVIHPKVMIAEGDFIYTPHQMINDGHSNNDMNSSGYDYYSNDYRNDEDDDEYYDDDTFIIGDEGIIVMSAPDTPPEMPVVTMDENAWMGHSKYNRNGSTLHVVNPDLNEEEDRQPKKRQLFRAQLQAVEEEEEGEEEEEEEEDEEKRENLDGDNQFSGLSMSPEIIHMYRSADQKQMKTFCEDPKNRDQTDESDSQSLTLKNIDRPMTSKSYQSLSDMILDEDEGSVCSQQMSSNTTTTSYGTLLHRLPRQARMAQVSISFVNATWTAMDIAQYYHEDESEKNFLGLASCVLKIWKELILGVGSMLDWRSRIKLQTVI